MPHSPEDKKRALTRLRRIRGQAEALERAVEAGTECAALLQQIAALRGAANGLMAEVLESHFRETFGQAGDAMAQKDDPGGQIDDIMRILRTYLK
ncbi:MAG: metal-sensing transcriptional repressor [Rhizobiales bacterium]|nr:metal-sensing transcriptional repressor [Hyphomicrobiales bacterium]OJY06753.1 MAG: regulator [Rhizobiales bacterium 63-22]